jgi:hypothetical protein
MKNIFEGYFWVASNVYPDGRPDYDIERCNKQLENKKICKQNINCKIHHTKAVRRQDFLNLRKFQIDSSIRSSRKYSVRLLKIILIEGKNRGKKNDCKRWIFNSQIKTYGVKKLF